MPMALVPVLPQAAVTSLSPASKKHARMEPLRAREPRSAASSSASEHALPQASEQAAKALPNFADETRTTVMLRHLPQDLSRDALVEILESLGLRGKFDFLYVPMHFMSHSGLGYAFVNMTSPDMLEEFWTAMDGFRAWPVAWKRACKVTWSSPFQGIQEHVDRYRNSRLLHPSVPDEVRPLLLRDGERIEFPAPTKALRAPRLRGNLNKA